MSRKRRAPSGAAPSQDMRPAASVSAGASWLKYLVFCGGVAAGAVVVVLMLRAPRTPPVTPGASPIAASAVSIVAPPDVDTASMQPRVRARIESALAEVRARPRAVDAWSELAQVCDVHSQYDCAEIAYRQAIALNPTDYRWKYLLAVLREMRGGEWGEVMGLFQDCAAADPEFTPIYFRMGEVLQRQGQNERAHTAFDKALELDPTLTIARRCLGQVLLVLGEVDAAIIELERAAAESPNDGPTQAALSQAYARTGQRELAQAASQKSLSLQSTLSLPDPIRFAVVGRGISAEQCYQRGETLLTEGQTAEALVQFRIAEESRPDDPGLKLVIADVLLRLQRNAEAETVLQRTVALAPQQSRARLLYGDLLLSTGRHDEAIEQFNAILERDPNHGAALGRRATALARGGDLAGARDDFEQAATLIDLDAQAHYNWGTVLLKMHEPGQAAAHYHQATVLFPSYTEAYVQLGLVAQATGHLEQATGYFRRAVELQPGHPIATARLESLSGGGG